MAKSKIKFICRHCGYETVKWMGKCPSCSSWDSFDEEVVEKSEKTVVTHKIFTQKINDIKQDNNVRIDIGIAEMNRVLGGGLVAGSMVLVGGDPGIGKSTILLQLCQSCQDRKKILYISGEESISQVGIRAQRLGVNSDNVEIGCETDLESVVLYIKETKPEIAIIDSIQTIYSTELTSVPGSANQVRNASLVLMKLAKSLNIAIFIVGHVTKDGNIAGPKILEHMVDTVLYFEGDRSSCYRILRAVKNRFGSTNEIGVFEMMEDGLKEVANPSLIMLEGRNNDAYGSCVTPVLEGTRPIMVEIQALVCSTAFGTPRRSANGFDNNRVTMLMAVLEKIVGLKIYNCDAYINIAGGIKVNEPACDLAIIASIASSFKNRAINSYTVVMGEAGLTGEVRGVSNINQRIAEAEKMGFKKAVIPSANVKNAKKISTSIEIIGVSNINEAIKVLFK